MKKIIVFPVLFLALLMVGCTVSPAFQGGVALIGPRLASEASSYAARDTTLDAPAKSMRAAQAATLRGNTAVAKDVERVKVEGAWLTVKPWLVAYYGADARLDSDERKLRLADSAKMDDLIAHEKARPFAK